MDTCCKMFKMYWFLFFNFLKYCHFISTTFWASCKLYYHLFFPAGFALQAYRGAQKPTPMEVMKTQARLADSASIQKASPPTMEIPTVEGRRHGTRTHKLKPRDMNILTPSGFWERKLPDAQTPQVPWNDDVLVLSSVYSSSPCFLFLSPNLFKCYRI